SGLATELLCRVSQVPDSSICTRRLLSPRRVQPLLLVDASGPMLASPLLEGWPLSAKFNEAETSSRNTTARAFAASGFDTQDCSRQPQSWLHDCRPFIMMNTFSSLEPPSFLGAPEGNRELLRTIGRVGSLPRDHLSVSLPATAKALLLFRSQASVLSVCSC